MQQRPVVRHRLAFYGALLLLGVVGEATAQQLFVRQYSVADGLVQSRIASLYQDSRGYLWIGTFDGLSRFDGERFTNYRRADGLPSTLVTSIAEDRRGRLWVATHGGGLARLIEDPREPGGPQTKFRTHAIVPEARGANEVYAMFFAPDGGLW
jgi:ligand-binding sensor domain-containing protein